MRGGVTRCAVHDGPSTRRLRMRAQSSSISRIFLINFMFIYATIAKSYLALLFSPKGLCGRRHVARLS